MEDQSNTPQIQIANPLQWQIGHGVTPDGSKICVLQLQQGQLSAALQLSVHDMEALGKGLVDASSQARSGLIIPTGAIGVNGHREE